LDGSIPPELLSPPASRDPSPRRVRQKSKSPARWKLMRSISDAVQDLMGRHEHGMYGTHRFVMTHVQLASLGAVSFADNNVQFLLYMTPVQDVLCVTWTLTTSEQSECVVLWKTPSPGVL